MVCGPNAVSTRVAQMWFKRFNSGNFMWKMRFALDGVTDKISAIFEKVEQERHISSYDVAEELDVGHKIVLRPLRKSECNKKTWHLGTTWSHWEEPNAVAVFPFAILYWNVTIPNHFLNSWLRVMEHG